MPRPTYRKGAQIMTGEMSKSEVTRDAYPYHFAAADQFDGATVQPFDTYQGPYVLIPKKGRFFLISEDGIYCQWYSERNDAISYGFFCDMNEDVAADAIADLVTNGGTHINRI